MLPRTNTNSFVSETSDDMITHEPWSIETYAEGLMDELFTDIDTILDGRNKRNHKHSRTGRSEYVSGQTRTLTMSDVLPHTVNLPQESVTPIINKQSSALVVKTYPVTSITTTTEQKRNSLSKLIFIGTALTITAIGVIYLKESRFLNNLINYEDPEILSIETQDDPLLTLVNYMQEALTVIDQGESINTQTTVKSGFPTVNINQTTGSSLPNNQATTSLSIPSTVNTLPRFPNQNTTQNVIERIYIPMSQPSRPNYQIPIVPPVPTAKNIVTPVETWKYPIDNIKNSTKTVTKPAPAKTIATTAKIPTVNNKPLSVNSQPLTIAPAKLPTPKLLTTVPPLPTNIEIKEPVKVTQQVYLPTYTAQLDGLLELGKKSVALFKIDGASRRISIGESIGTTGWTLVEVSNGEAIIRRNGEVRSIYTGQKL